jgi:hypothetical protein
MDDGVDAWTWTGLLLFCSGILFMVHNIFFFFFFFLDKRTFLNIRVGKKLILSSGFQPHILIIIILIC